MRIDAYNQISQIYGVNGKVKTSAASRVTKSDKVEISSFGKELQIAKQAVSEAPDVREDLVSKFKTEIAMVLMMLMEKHLLTSLWKNLV